MSRSYRTPVILATVSLAWWLACLAFSFSTPILAKYGCASESFCRYNDGWDTFFTATKFALLTLLPVVLIATALITCSTKYHAKRRTVAVLCVVSGLILLSLIPLLWGSLVTGEHFWID